MAPFAPRENLCERDKELAVSEVPFSPLSTGSHCSSRTTNFSFSRFGFCGEHRVTRGQSSWPAGAMPTGPPRVTMASNDRRRQGRVRTQLGIREFFLRGCSAPTEQAAFMLQSLPSKGVTM